MVFSGLVAHMSTTGRERRKLPAAVTFGAAESS